MRTIKFRGRSRKTGEWLVGDLLQVANEVFIAPSNGDWFDFIPWSKNNVFHLPSARYQVIPDTVGQFTGLLDKNGTEIYEGDIVKTILHDSRRQMFFKVIYSMDYCGFELQEYGRYSGGYLWNFDDFDEGSLIIIGNIHDNPELLTLNK